MIILRQKNYSRFDLTPEEQEIWDKSVKRDGRKPNLKELIQQAKKYKKGESSFKELDDMGIDHMKPEYMTLEYAGPKVRWGNGTWANPYDHDDVVRSRIAKKKLGKISRNVGIATLGTAALVGGGIAIHKARKKKKAKKEKDDNSEK